MKIKEVGDRLLLRELVDRVSVLADRKDFDRQVRLFSEDGVSETYAGGNLILSLKGRKEMAKTFSDFLKGMDIVFHLNGQQLVTIDGDRAAGTLYCQITLIGQENGKTVQTSIGAVYQDNYIRENNDWLIAKRTGTFSWHQKFEVNT
jgi:hypothetical protein